MTQMPQPRMSPWVSRSGEVLRMPLISTQRGGHGGMAWPSPFAEQAEQSMMQPQDGAVDARVRLASIRSHQHSDLLHESEDARLTGGTRSLDRRLLGLNVLDTYAKRQSVRAEAIAETDVA
ncbi:MAG: hypothetical protein WB439_16405 [Acidobacteriaceae bacterium]